jgi:hypothetical protein
MLQLIIHSLPVAAVVYVWLLSPFPEKIARVLTPTKTPLNTLQGVIDYCRLELADAAYCDKCNGFWWGLAFGFFFWNYTGVTLLFFACINVVLTKLIYNNVE